MTRKYKVQKEFRYPNQKVSADERAELLNLWLAGDMPAVFKLQKQLGVDRKYTQRRAFDAGMTKDKPSKHHSDHRWEWAIERGEIVI